MGIFGDLLSGLAGGGSAAIDANTQQMIQDNIAFQQQGFNLPGMSGRIGQNTNTLALGQQEQMIRNALSQQVPGLLSGGLANLGGVSSGLQQANLGAALGQVQGATGAQSGSTAFGNLGTIAGTATGLGGQFLGQTAQGPQDFSGGLQANLFNQGAANIGAAGNQQALFNQSLDVQRQAAGGGLLDRAINKLQDRQFAQGRLGSTGGAQETEAFLNAVAQQDLGFQDAAFGRAQAEAGRLGQLGMAQIGQGAGLLGQNLGQFNTQTGLGMDLLGLGMGAEGQQFGQGLQAAGFNTQQGMNRLAAAQGVLGFGGDLFAQQFGLGLASQQGLLDQQNTALQAILGLRNAEANRIAGVGHSANALSSSGQAASTGFGSFLGGIASILPF